MATTPNRPKFGNRISATRFHEEVIQPLVGNDVSSEARIAALELLLSGITDVPNRFIQSTSPVGPEEGDDWFDTTDPTRPIHKVYVSGQWIEVKDPTAQTAADVSTAVSVVTQTLVQPTMPTSVGSAGWIWVDTSIGGQNKTYVSTAAYNPPGSGILPGQPGSQWELITDTNAQLLAAAVTALEDGKTELFIQNDVPDAADERDLWVDDDGNNQVYVCRLEYIATDGDAWDNLTDYVAGQYVSSGTTYYVALLDSGPGTGAGFRDPVTEPTYWSSVGNFGQTWSAGTNYFVGNVVFTSGNYYLAIADSGPAAGGDKDPTSEPATWALLSGYTQKQAFKHGYFWLRTTDPVAKAKAEAADTVASGKSATYYDPNVPNTPSVVYNVNDWWIDTDDSNQAYVNTSQYTGDGVTDFSANWDPIADSVARARFGDIDNKTEVFYQTELPTAAGRNDLWVDLDNGNTVFISDLKYIATDGSAWGAGTTYATGDIVSSGSSYYQSNSDGNIGNAPPHATWDALGIPHGSTEVQPYNAGTTYDEQDLVTDAGKIWRSKVADNTGNTPAGSPTKWAEVSTSTTDAAIFRALRWKWASDSHARDLATIAQGTADGKTVTYHQPTIPDSAEEGDQWVNTDPTATINITDVNGANIQHQPVYICDLAYNGGVGVIGTHWKEYIDPGAQKLAIETQAIVDNKRTTFYTTNHAEPATKWPGSGEDGGQIQIDFWPSLPANDSGYKARKGDIWINEVGGDRYTRVCIQGYNGDSGDPGAVANWASLVEDATFTTELDQYYKLNGDNPITAPIDFTGGGAGIDANQDFNGRDMTLANAAVIKGDGEIWYGGTSGAPGSLATEPDSAIVHKKHVQEGLDLKEDLANKATDLTSPDNVKYPTTLATQTALDLKEDLANKATDLTSPDNVKYPTTLAVENAIETAISTARTYYVTPGGTGEGLSSGDPMSPADASALLDAQPSFAVKLIFNASGTYTGYAPIIRSQVEYNFPVSGVVLPSVVSVIEGGFLFIESGQNPPTVDGIGVSDGACFECRSNITPSSSSFLMNLDRDAKCHVWLDNIITRIFLVGNCDATVLFTSSVENERAVKFIDVSDDSFLKLVVGGGASGDAIQAGRLRVYNNSAVVCADNYSFIYDLTLNLWGGTSENSYVHHVGGNSFVKSDVLTRENTLNNSASKILASSYAGAGSNSATLSGVFLTGTEVTP